MSYAKHCLTAFLLSVVLCASTGYAQDSLAGVAPKVNINQAGVEELAESLDGVGERRARAIVESREQEGPFTSIEALSRVKGIGAATVEDNRERIQLR